MNFRTTLLLVVCLAVLGGVYALTRNLGRPVDGADAGPLVTGTVDAVTVQRGERSYELRRTLRGWAQTAPVWYPLSVEAGQRLMAAVSGLVPQQSLTPGVGGDPTLAELALDPPGAIVTMIGSDGAQEFLLGDITVSDSAYLQAEDGRAWIVPAALHNMVYEGWPEMWRSRTLPLPPPGSVQRILRLLNGQPVTILRNEGRWGVVDLPGNPRVSPVFLSALEDLARRVEVNSFLPNDGTAEGRRGFDEPTLELELEDPEGGITSLVVGRAADIEGRTVFAKIQQGERTTPVLTLPRSAIEPLLAPPPDLRDPRLFEAPVDLVYALEIRRAGLPTLSFAERGLGLVPTEASGALPEGVSPRRLLEAILALSTEQTLSGLTGDEEPAAGVTLRWGVRSEAAFELFRRGDRWVAQPAGSPVAYELDRASMGALPIPLAAD